jgi:hypothetical protein
MTMMMREKAFEKGRHEFSDESRMRKSFTQCPARPHIPVVEWVQVQALYSRETSLADSKLHYVVRSRDAVVSPVCLLALGTLSSTNRRRLAVILA